MMKDPETVAELKKNYVQADTSSFANLFNQFSNKNANYFGETELIK